MGWLWGWGRGGLEAACLPMGGLCPPRSGSCLALGVPPPGTCGPLGGARSWGKKPRWLHQHQCSRGWMFPSMPLTGVYTPGDPTAATPTSPGDPRSPAGRSGPGFCRITASALGPSALGFSVSPLRMKPPSPPSCEGSCS